MARRQRSDSAAAQVAAARSSRPITPPSNVPLTDGDLPFFASVIAEFARSDWTAHSLELAAMLARTMADLEREQVEMRREGSVAMSEKGTPVVNPRKTVIQMHAGSILSFRRSLQLHARARNGEARDAGTGQRDRKAADQVGDDELLARPS